MTRLEQLGAASSELKSYLERCQDTGDVGTISGFVMWLTEMSEIETESQRFWYELRFRPLGPGCQPKGFVDQDDSCGRHGIVAYDRPLTDAELANFEMRPWSK